MKIKVYRKIKQWGSAMVTCLVLCTVLSLFLMYYLSLTQQQTLLSARSQSWNMAIAVTEAGLEEGLQQLNESTANLVANGWSFNGTVYQSPLRTFPDGSAYQVVIDMSQDPFNPGIVSLSYMNPPAFASAQPTAFFAQIVPSPVAGSSSLQVSRAVHVRCTRGNLLIKGMVAKHRIDMNGNDILTDSFDSTDPTKSVAGQYDPNFFVGDNGDVASNDSLANSVGVGNANIYGHVIVGKGGGVAVGSNGGVGDHTWQAANAGGIQPNYFNDNANFTFPDQFLPNWAGYLAPLPGSSIATTNYTFSTNAVVGSTTYPNPVPPDGVVTNVITVKNVQSWPNQPGATVTTNCGSNIIDAGKNIPPHELVCGTPWQNGNGDKNNSDWYFYPIASYNYTYNTYTYNLYSTNTTVTYSDWDYILDDGNYVLPLTALHGRVLVRGNATLVLPRGINMNGSDVVQIAAGGSLTVYAAGATDTIGGNGIINQSGFAANCTLNFTPATTTLNFNGNGEFIGSIVAPEAHVNMNGGGHSVNDFIGALMADSITMLGHYQFHYDEALGKRGAKSRFIIMSWDEVDPHSLPPTFFAAAQ